MKSLLLVFFLLFVSILINNCRRDFPVVDEIAHLPAGASHVEFGRFDLYRVNPHLVRFLSVGLGGYEAKFEWSMYSESIGKRPEFTIGVRFLNSNGLTTGEHYFHPRLVALGFWALGIVMMHVIVRRAASDTTAAIATILWMASPNILAHSPTILPDVGAVSIGLLACFAAWHYLHRPGFGSAFLAGAAMGLALLTKLTWITALVTIPITASICVWFLAGKVPRRRWRSRVGDLMIFWIVSLYVLNTGYAFEGSFTQLGKFEFCSEMLGGEGSNARVHGNRFEDTWLAAVPVPFPKNYVQGIDYLKMEVEQKRWSFLLGEWKFGSWPHYYLMTTLIKTPEPTLIAAALGVVVFVLSVWKKLASPELISMVALLTIPAAACFASVSLQGGFNHHHRYVLMIYPPMFLFASLLVSPLARQVFSGRKQDAAENADNGDRHHASDGPEPELRQESTPQRLARSPSLTRRVSMRFRALAQGHWTEILGVLLVSLSVISSLRVHPHYVSYFNTLSGGPENGWRLLGFSNIDWGQDLLEVDEWIKKYPECRPLSFDLDYFSTNGEIFGLPRATPPKLPKGGSIDEVRTDETQWWVVNVKRLYNLSDRTGLEYLQQLEPADKIAYAYHVYRIDPK